MTKKKWSLLVVLALLLGIVGFLPTVTSFANSNSAGMDPMASLASVTISCQAGAPPTIMIYPEPVVVQPGSRADWFISDSCVGVFNTIAVIVPDLGYDTGAIAPPAVTPGTPPIPTGSYPYVVNGTGPDVTVSGTIIATNNLPNPIGIAFQDAVGNPYCDGVSMNHELPNGYAISGNQCGCATGAIQGSFVGQANPVIPTGTGAFIVIPDWQIYTKIKFNPRSWAHYSYDGTPVNSGTFAIGCPVLTDSTSSLGN